MDYSSVPSFTTSSTTLTSVVTEQPLDRLISGRRPQPGTHARYNWGYGCSFNRLALRGAAILIVFAASLLQGQKTGAAISRLEAEARRFPSDARVQFNLGLALVQAGRLDEAISPLKRAAQDPALAAEAHFTLGADYFESKKYLQAIQELEGLTESAHGEEVLYMIEESNRRLGRVDQAKAAFHQLITRYPDSAWLHYLMGNAYEDQQQFDQAIAEYEAALKKDPDIPNGNFAIGYIYWRQQDTENARRWLQKETQKGCHSLANFYLGELARGERDLAQAESYYRRALMCDPSNGEAHLRLGIVLAEEKRITEAISQLKQAIRLQPDSSSAHYHLAEIYSHLGRNAEAQAEYRRVRQIQAAKDNGTSLTGANSK